MEKEKIFRDIVSIILLDLFIFLLVLSRDYLNLSKLNMISIDICFLSFLLLIGSYIIFYDYAELCNLKNILVINFFIIFLISIILVFINVIFDSKLIGILGMFSLVVSIISLFIEEFISCLCL